MSLRKIQDILYNLGTTNIWEEKGKYLAENTDNLLYLSMRYSFANTAKDNKSSRLQGWVILECKSVIKKFKELMKTFVLVYIHINT